MKMTWAYIGGFFDGEGCVGRYESDGYIRLHVSMSQQTKRSEVLDEIRQFLEARGIHAGIHHDKRGMTQILMTGSESVVKFLKCVSPHLRVKLEAADEMLLWLDANPRQPHGRVSRFSRKDVRRMFRLWKSGRTQESIAEEFGTAQAHVSRLIRNLIIPV